MTEPRTPAVVELVDAGVPADQGLSSLGLLMQLAGNVFAAYAALATFALVFSSSFSSRAEMLSMFLLLGLSIARSLLQRAAGNQLVYGLPGEPGQRMRGVRRYAMFGLAHSALFGVVLFAKLGANLAVVGIVGGLAAWPVTLLGLMALPRFKRFRDELPVTEDKGFEGASILMTILGACGLAGTLTVLAALLGMPDRELQRGPGVLVALALVMLLIRSIIHVQAGVSGLRVTSVDRAVELANRYASFGVISSFCGGGALLLFLMFGIDGLSKLTPWVHTTQVSVGGLALVCCLCWMLMAWPMIVRRFFSDRQFEDLLAGDAAPIHRRAPDAGLTWLGWLLIAHAVFTTSFLLPELFMDQAVASARFQGLLALGGAMALRSLWWSVGLVILQGWAGYELVRMSVQSRIIATVFGIVGTAVTVYINWPIIQMLRDTKAFLGAQEAMTLGPLALSLVIPIATILLVHRKIAPTARARFKTRPTPA